MDRIVELLKTEPTDEDYGIKADERAGIIRPSKKRLCSSIEIAKLPKEEPQENLNLMMNLSMNGQMNAFAVNHGRT